MKQHHHLISVMISISLSSGVKIMVLPVWWEGNIIGMKPMK